jgi:hypothetical protein
VLWIVDNLSCPSNEEITIRASGTGAEAGTPPIPSTRGSGPRVTLPVSTPIPPCTPRPQDIGFQSDRPGGIAQVSGAGDRNDGQLYPGAEPSVDQSRCGLERQELPRRGIYVSYALRSFAQHPSRFWLCGVALPAEVPRSIHRGPVNPRDVWGLGQLVTQRALVQIPRLRAADAPARRPNTAPETSPAPLG